MISESPVTMFHNIKNLINLINCLSAVLSQSRPRRASRKHIFCQKQLLENRQNSTQYKQTNIYIVSFERVVYIIIDDT